MDRNEVDQLYHHLRTLRLQGSYEQKQAVRGITLHLTSEAGDYPELLTFLDYYGRVYLLPKVVKALQTHKNFFQFDHIVEIGAGTGWLGRGLTTILELESLAVLVDKRQFTLIDIVADVETPQGQARVCDELRPNDLIVMSEALHCFSNPRNVIKRFESWPMVVIEYSPINISYKTSYEKQLSLYGASPISDCRSLFPNSIVQPVPDDTHCILLVKPL